MVFKLNRGNDRVKIYDLKSARFWFSDEVEGELELEEKGRKLTISGADKSQVRGRNLNRSECNLELIVDLKTKTYKIKGLLLVGDILSQGKGRLQVNVGGLRADKKYSDEGVEKYREQKNHTDGFSMMGQSQPARDDLFVTWMSEDKARMDHGEDTSIIIRLDTMKMYIVNHAEMTYVEMAIGGKDDILSNAIAGSGLSDEEQAEAKKMMQGFAAMMKPEVSVTETGETQEIKIDYELYRSLTYSVMGQTPGIEDMMKEMGK